MPMVLPAKNDSSFKIAARRAGAVGKWAKVIKYLLDLVEVAFLGA
jgi:hypothetical protein